MAKNPEQTLTETREALTKAQDQGDDQALAKAQAAYADASSALDRHRDQIGRADPVDEEIAIGDSRRGITAPPKINGGTR